MTLTRRPLLSLVRVFARCSSAALSDFAASGSGGVTSKSFFLFAMAANLPAAGVFSSAAAAAVPPASTSSFFSSLTLGSVVFSSGLAESSDPVTTFSSSPSSTGSFLTCTSVGSFLLSSASAVSFFASPAGVDSFLTDVEFLIGLDAAPASELPPFFASSTAADGFESSPSTSSLVSGKERFLTTMPCFFLYSITSFGTT
mmetsp:Transcript_23476/g.50857  ORF Transcript_23476/g.50857 Transcript_23476/m.50857 type:complete len:200 (-) Transcript_23476:2109-2708(-)